MMVKATGVGDGDCLFIVSVDPIVSVHVARWDVHCSEGIIFQDHGSCSISFPISKQ